MEKKRINQKEPKTKFEIEKRKKKNRQKMDSPKVKI